jgi:hypothetical protein
LNVDIYDESGTVVAAVDFVPPHPIECERKCADCTNAAPERTLGELHTSIMNVIHNLKQGNVLTAKLEAEEAQQYCEQLLQPAPTESDEAVARELHKAGLLHGYDPDEAMDRAADIIAKHRQPVAPSRTAEEVNTIAGELLNTFMGKYLRMDDGHNLISDEDAAKSWREGKLIIQSALDAAKVEGARLALEAAAEHFEKEYGLNRVAEKIRALDPAAIVKGVSHER